MKGTIMEFVTELRIIEAPRWSKATEERYQESKREVRALLEELGLV